MDHVGIADVSPILIELIRRGFLRIEPDGALLGFAHLFAFAVLQQFHGQTEYFFSVAAAVQFDAADDVAPLIVAAQLHDAAILTVEHEEIVTLHQHIVQLEERETPLQALLIAFRGQHPIHGEMYSDFAQKVNVIQIAQPIGIVDHQRVAI